MFNNKRSLYIIDRRDKNIFLNTNDFYFFDEKKLIYRSCMERNKRNKYSKKDIVELEKLEQYINLFYFYDDHKNIYYYDENKFEFVIYSIDDIEEQFIKSTKYKNSKIDLRHCSLFIRNTLIKYKNNNLLNYKKQMIESEKPIEILNNIRLSNNPLSNNLLTYITLLNFYKLPSYTKHKVIIDEVTELKKKIKELRKEIREQTKEPQKKIKELQKEIREQTKEPQKQIKELQKQLNELME